MPPVPDLENILKAQSDVAMVDLPTKTVWYRDANGKLFTVLNGEKYGLNQYHEIVAKTMKCYGVTRNNKNCATMINNCILNGDINGCKNALGDMYSSDQIIQDINRMEPYVAIKLLHRLGFNISDVHVNGKFVKQVESVDDWFKRTIGASASAPASGAPAASAPAASGAAAPAAASAAPAGAEEGVGGEKGAEEGDDDDFPKLKSTFGSSRIQLGGVHNANLIRYLKYVVEYVNGNPAILNKNYAGPAKQTRSDRQGSRVANKFDQLGLYLGSKFKLRTPIAFPGSSSMPIFGNMLPLAFGGQQGGGDSLPYKTIFDQLLVSLEKKGMKLEEGQRKTIAKKIDDLSNIHADVIKSINIIQNYNNLAKLGGEKQNAAITPVQMEQRIKQHNEMLETLAKKELTLAKVFKAVAYAIEKADEESNKPVSALPVTSKPLNDPKSYF